MIRQGQRGDAPLGGLQLETWSEDGSVRGRRFRRVGRRYSEILHQRRWQKVSACHLTVTRDQQGSASRVLLTDRPKVMLERWRYSTGWLRIIDSGVLKIES